MKRKRIAQYPIASSDIRRIKGSENVNRIRVMDLQGRMLKEVFEEKADIQKLIS